MKGATEDEIMIQKNIQQLQTSEENIYCLNKKNQLCVCYSSCVYTFQKAVQTSGPRRSDAVGTFVSSMALKTLKSYNFKSMLDLHENSRTPLTKFVRQTESNGKTLETHERSTFLNTISQSAEKQTSTSKKNQRKQKQAPLTARRLRF